MRYSKELHPLIALKWMRTILNFPQFKITLSYSKRHVGLWRVTISTNADHYVDDLNTILSALLKLI